MGDKVTKVVIVTDLNDPNKEREHVIDGNVGIIRVFCERDNGDEAEIVIGYPYDMPGPGVLGMYKRTTTIDVEGMDDVFTGR